MTRIHSALFFDLCQTVEVSSHWWNGPRLGFILKMYCGVWDWKIPLCRRYLVTVLQDWVGKSDIIV